MPCMNDLGGSRAIRGLDVRERHGRPSGSSSSMYVIAPLKINRQSVSPPREPERRLMATELAEGKSMSAMCTSFGSSRCCGDANCQILNLQDRSRCLLRVAGTRQAILLGAKICQVFTASQALAQCFVPSKVRRLLQKARVTSFPSSSREGGFSTTTDCVAARSAAPDGCADMPPLLVAEELRHNTPGQQVDKQPWCCTSRRHARVCHWLSLLPTCRGAPGMSLVL